MARALKFVNDHIYHIFNRGVMKRDIFLSTADYFRWVDLMRWYLRYDYSYSRFLGRIKQAQSLGGKPAEVAEVKQIIARFHRLPQKPVEIITWVLMPNHFHMVLKQITEDGISAFLHRISNAYSHYFNRKNDSSGSLFQGRFKAVLVETEGQFLHVCRYNHINPLAAGLTTKKGLSRYPWSSLQSYLAGEDDSVTTKEDLLAYYKSVSSLEEFTLASFASQEISVLEDLTHDDDFGWYTEIEEQKKAHREKLIEELKTS